MVCTVITQKTYSIESLRVSLNVTGNSSNPCLVQVQEVYAFLFQGGNFTSANIPIQKDALYLDTPLVSNLQVISNDTGIQSAIFSSTSQGSSAAYIRVSFLPGKAM
jgi:hypothetical protein